GAPVPVVPVVPIRDGAAALPPAILTLPLQHFVASLPEAAGAGPSKVPKLGRRPLLDDVAPRPLLRLPLHAEARAEGRPSVQGGPTLLPAAVAVSGGGTDRIVVPRA